MKRIIVGLSILVLFINQIVSAQNEPKPPVFKVSFSNNSPKTGDIVELIIKCDIPEGLHMYSTNSKCDIGPIPFSAIFKENKSYCLQGNLKSIGDKIKMDDVFNCEIGVFEKKAEFRQKIKVLTNDLKVSFNVEGQWCTEIACFNFGSLIPINLTGQTKATGTPIACDSKTTETSPTIIEPVEVPTVDSTIKIDTLKTSVTSSKSNASYRLTPENSYQPCLNKTFNGLSSETENENNWGLFVIAFLSGLAGLLTPCVFPMIPMTISFFMKDNKSKHKTIINGLFFGISIILIYVLLGSVVSALLGPDAGNFLSTHWVPNIIFFIVFMVFAFSFFGAFEIMLPSWLSNKVDREADKGGFYGIFFMALTLAIVSFSCTGPIVGNVIVESAKGGSPVRPIIAMFGFGLAFALPFTIFAIFPHLLKSLPKSGGWLNSVKVVFGFLELALALKFLSIIDQTYHWHLLDREVYLSLWIIIFGLMGVYLLGKIKFAHDSELKFLGVPRLLFTVLTFSFVMYMIPGLWGAPLKALAGYLPPMSTQDFDINRSLREVNGIKGNMCSKPSYANELHIPHGLNAYFDYEEAVACSKELKKPLFIDFTGHGCVNCRKMEELVWSDPRVLKILNEEYVIASLFVDDKKIKLPESDYFIGKFSQQKITTLGKKNAEIQICYFNSSSQPMYCLLDNDEELLRKPEGSEINKKQFDTEEFLKFLEEGVKEFKKRNK
jgi:thiol:disulfide interchange protein DsbD